MANEALNKIKQTRQKRIRRESKTAWIKGLQATFCFKIGLNFQKKAGVIRFDLLFFQDAIIAVQRAFFITFHTSIGHILNIHAFFGIARITFIISTT